MEKQDLLKRVGEVSLELERSFSNVLFVKSETIEQIYGKLNSIIIDLSIEGVKVENFVENEIQFCGNCRQKVSLRKMRIDSGMISGLIKAFNFVMKNRRQVFQIQEVALIPQEYSKLNHLVRFGLLYKSDEMKNGEYGVPRRTVSKFLAGDWRVAEFYETDPTKKEGEEGRRFMSEKRITINEIPSVGELKKNYGEKLVEYDWNFDFE